MKSLSQIIKEEKLEEYTKDLLICRTWVLLDQLRYNPLYRREKTMHYAHAWLLYGLFKVTFENLKTLYSLLLPTQRIRRTSELGGAISALLSNLFDINTASDFPTSLSQNFRSVERFIFMLSSGAYQLRSLPNKSLFD